MLTHNASTSDAVVDESVLLSETLAAVATGEQDGQLVLSLFSVEVDKLVFLFGRRNAAAFLSLCTKYQKKKRSK